MEAQEGNSSDIRWPETEVGSANASNTSNFIEDFNDVPSNQGDFDHFAIDPSVRPSKKIKYSHSAAIDYQTADSEHVLKRARPFGISDENNDNQSLVDVKPRADESLDKSKACAFRDSYEKFKKAGAEVVGISGDDVSSHKVLEGYDLWMWDMIC
ncbi:hypothetical protein Ancab_007267 [Ancistrocladus abbreviatus]